jgi:hypothetical protein
MVDPHLLRARRAGSAQAPRRLPGIEAPPRGRRILALKREFAESVRSQSSLRAYQVALAPMLSITHKYHG